MSIPSTNRFSAICRWMVVVSVMVLPQLASGTQWHATVGAQSNSKGRQALAFLPNEIWIHEGDSIAWKFATDEIHTLTFLTAMQVRPPFPVGCPGFSSTPCLRRLRLRHHASADDRGHVHRGFSANR